ncbi:hypothetical protein L6164_007831 [Bauhinia variegata]|nr:hypothetical protein L6164_007831 [Bauhinia variegata]
MEITEMNHPSHPHTLTLKPPGVPYHCSGCQELGFGPSYRCDYDDCRFILHDECANAPSTGVHRFFKNSHFKFYEQPPGSKTRVCDACGKDILGFVYHCPRTEYDLHPCCMKLKESISDNGAKITLKLCNKVPSNCLKCNSRNTFNGIAGWSYASRDGKYCYHVSCVKEMVVEKWKMGYFSAGESNRTQMLDYESQVAMTSTEMMQIGQGSIGRTVSKYIRIAKIMFKLIFSAIFGDPISAIAALVEAMVSN